MIEVDPRFKILSFLFLAWSIALTESVEKLLFYLPIVGMVSFLFLKGRRFPFKVFLFADSFILLVLITQLFLGSKEVALLVFLRSNEILLLSVSLLSSSSVFEILHALHHLKVPNSLLQVAFLSYRYLNELSRKFELTLKSAKCRGFTPSTGKITYMTYAHLVANLLAYSSFKSERVYKAMLCRGFNGYFPVFRHFKATYFDYLFLTATLGYGVLVWNL
ncbi:energy-coupling factor transporter transmembrane component T family protein [Thermovibrio sp.]